MKKRKTHWTVLEKIAWHARNEGFSGTTMVGSFGPRRCKAPCSAKRGDPRVGVCAVHGEFVYGRLPDGTIRYHCDGIPVEDAPRRDGDRMLLKRRSGKMKLRSSRARSQAPAEPSEDVLDTLREADYNG